MKGSSGQAGGPADAIAAEPNISMASIAANRFVFNNIT
jgi:hypothetical protein